MEKLTEADQVKIYKMQTEMLVGQICTAAYKESISGRFRVSTLYFSNCNRLDVDIIGEKVRVDVVSLNLEPQLDKLNPTAWALVVLELNKALTKIKEL